MMPLRVFFMSYTAANLGLLAYGVLALLNPDILLDSFSLHIYQFPDDAITASAYLSALFRLLGFFNLSFGILGLVLLWQYRVRHQPWILRVVVASSLFTYLGPLVFDNTVGNIGVFEMIEHILFAGMILSGILMLREHGKIESIYDAE